MGIKGEMRVIRGSYGVKRGGEGWEGILGCKMGNEE